jgi:simple sugar transport system permease protein
MPHNISGGIMDRTLLLGLILTTLAFSAPLLLAALGELIGERAGVLNIGLEGMMLTGALAGAAVSFATSNAAIGLLLAMMTGMALAVILRCWRLRCAPMPS